MPWVTLIIFVLSYFLSTKKGMSKGKAALVAAGVAGTAYATIEPTNENAILADKLYNDEGIFSSVTSAKELKANQLNDLAGAAASGKDGHVPETAPGIGSQAIAAISKLGNTAIEQTAGVAKSWGPAGTTLAVGGISGKWWLVGAGAALLFLMR